MDSIENPDLGPTLGSDPDSLMDCVRGSHVIGSLEGLP